MTITTEQLTIVSGLARGVDSAAHRGALSAGGRTIAVLGCGADVVYPAEHARLAGDIVCSGAIVSDFLPGTEPTENCPLHQGAAENAIDKVLQGIRKIF